MSKSEREGIEERKKNREEREERKREEREKKLKKRKDERRKGLSIAHYRIYGASRTL